MQAVIDAIRRESSGSTNIDTATRGNQLWITYNRPKSLNSFSLDMYLSLKEALLSGNQQPSIKYIVINGAGGNFSSGNDLNNFMNPILMQMETLQMAQTMAAILQELTDAMINSSKPIFAIVEGRCVGFAFTQLALFDRVFATKNALFMAPLVKIAQGPEMCSSFTFPKVFGLRLAEDLIAKGHSTTAQDLAKFGFLTVCDGRVEAEKMLAEHIAELDQLDWASYSKSRQLIKATDRPSLIIANREECANLIERWSNPELPALMMAYMQRKTRNLIRARI